jgi:hypothetical protein
MLTGIWTQLDDGRRCAAAMLVGTLLWLGCSASPSNPAHDGAAGATSADATSSDGAGGTAGNRSCGLYARDTSTLRGSGFGTSEGGTVVACLHPSQPVDVPACGSARVTGGAFTITESVCSAGFWEVELSGVTCYPVAVPGDEAITPCTCYLAANADPSVPHPLSTSCDGGPADGGSDASDHAAGGPADVTDAPEGL